MMIMPNGPACDCDTKCFNTSSSLASTVDRKSDPSRQVEQDSISPNSFFRLSSEIRAKIYFLSTRPDCRHSFGASEGCDKRHIHQSDKGRRAAWKWLVMCRQTWKEANAYMPIANHNIVLTLNDETCARCHCRVLNVPDVRESSLHAGLEPKLGSHLRYDEIWLARLQKVTLNVFRGEYELIYPNGQYQDPDYVGRFVHNLRSLVAFINKLRDLRYLTIQVNIEFGSAITSIPDVRDQFEQLFRILKRPAKVPVVKVKISQQTLIYLSAGGRTRQKASPTGAEALLELATKAGFESHEVDLVLTELSKQKFPWDGFPEGEEEDEFADFGGPFDTKKFDEKWLKITAQNEREELEWRRKISDLPMWKTDLFDEDFADMPEDVSHYRSDSGSGPTYIIMQGCMIYRDSKYKKADDFLPLYFEEDFCLGFETAQAEYDLIPECPICKTIFAAHSQVDEHDRACIRAWTDSKTNLQLVKYEQSDLGRPT